MPTPIGNYVKGAERVLAAIKSGKNPTLVDQAMLGLKKGTLREGSTLFETLPSGSQLKVAIGRNNEITKTLTKANGEQIKSMFGYASDKPGRIIFTTNNYNVETWMNGNGRFWRGNVLRHDIMLVEGADGLYSTYLNNSGSKMLGHNTSQIIRNFFKGHTDVKQEQVKAILEKFA